MRIIVHIGPHKTGSTSIQSALKNSAQELRNQNIYYPVHTQGSARVLPGIFFGNNRKWGFGLREIFGTIGALKEISSQFWHELEKQVQSEKPQTTIISSERFSSFSQPKQLINRLEKNFDDVKIIYYVRDPVDLFLSSINQNIRGGTRFEDLKTPWTYAYSKPKRLQRYISLLGKENIIVRNFDRSNLIDGDVVDDFFHIVSTLVGGKISFSRNDAFKNPSLSAAASVWLMTINETFERFSETDDQEILQRRRLVINHLLRSDSIAALPKFEFPDQIPPEIIRHNARDTIDWFNEGFLQDQVKLVAPVLDATFPSPEEIQKQMRDWMLGYLTPEAISAVVTELVTVGKSGVLGPANGIATRRTHSNNE